MTISLRDPAGQVCLVDGRILRIINESGISDFNAFINSAASQSFLGSRQLVGTTILEDQELDEIFDDETTRSLLEQKTCAMVVEHERVPFQSFPYEWPAEMLHLAARLTLDMAEKLLDEGLGLKDATPYNVLFRGPHPVFVDLLSFEQRDPSDPTWLPYAQFVRTFLLPLLVNKHFGISLKQLLTTHRDGIEPEEVSRLCSTVQKLSPPFLSMVTLPALLNSKAAKNKTEIYEKKSMSDPERARFILSRVLKNVRRQLEKVAPHMGRRSNWSNYMAHNNYTQDYFPIKQSFVEDVLAYYHPKRVLDVGCNTGHFSALAARLGASVVAIDYDAVVVGEVWRKASAGNLDILPLVVDLARPTPSTGWRNSECPSFLERARGEFDCVLMLAVIHHMLVGERIPLAEIVALASELTTDVLVIEFVAPSDPMFKRISRGRDHLFIDLTREFFEATCRKHFEIVHCERLDQTDRWLYLMKKKGARA